MSGYADRFQIGSHASVGQTDRIPSSVPQADPDAPVAPTRDQLIDAFLVEATVLLVEASRYLRILVTRSIETEHAKKK